MRAACLVCLGALLSAWAIADTDHELGTIHVKGILYEAKKKIDLEHVPVNNSNITDYLKTNVNVRFEDEADSATNANIRPQSISIHGADPEQTAFTIDGVSINNDWGDHSSIFDGSMGVTPGRSSEQAYFFDARLLDSVTVYDSNIPVNYGGFTGGVVDAKVKHYSGKDETDLSFRSTGSSWTALKLDPSERERFYRAIPNGFEAAFQPKYRKSFYQASIARKLGKLGLVLGVSRRDSYFNQARLIHPNGDRDFQKQRYRSDNVLATLNYQWDTHRTLELDWRYSNYDESKFHAQQIGSNVHDTHDAQGLTWRYKQNLWGGKLTGSLAYDVFRDDRRFNQNQATQYINFDDPDLFYELGGYGRSHLRQQQWRFSLDHESKEYTLLGTHHKFLLGLNASQVGFDFKRDANVTTTQIYFDDLGIIDYIPPMQSIAKAGQIKTSYRDLALYIQDTMDWHSLTLRPGVRLDVDNYMKRINIAPRLWISYTAPTDTTVDLGLNRYYGRSFATMKLTGEVLQLSDETSTRFTDVADLKTPFADEARLSISQRIANLDVHLAHTHRRYRNRIVALSSLRGTDIVAQDKYVNDSDYRASTYTIQIANIDSMVLGGTRWNASFGADYSRIYRDQIVDPNEAVYLDGQLMTRSKMHQSVNNQQEQWIARIALDMDYLSWGLQWSNKVYIKAPVNDYEYIDDHPINDIPMYRKYHFGTLTQWDSSVYWKPAWLLHQHAYVKLEVLNVLNQTRRTIRGSGLYTPGREFWLEVGASF